MSQLDHIDLSVGVRLAFLHDRIIRVGQQRHMVLTAIPIVEPGCYIVQFNALYGRIPFDGERLSGEAPVLIEAVEQRMYFAAANQQASGNAR